MTANVTERTAPPAEPAPVEPMDPQVRSIQPGGGVVCRLELAWGYWRRFWLKTFRPGYVRRMAATRKGTANGCPHEVLDPRDVKFFQNQDGYHWAPADDPFRWRDRIPFARWGLAELMVFSALTFGPAAALAGWLLASEPLPAARRWSGGSSSRPWWCSGSWSCGSSGTRPAASRGAGLVVSPADGKVVAIDEVAHDEFLGGPAIRIGIFLSIFNVHINRAPVAGRVIGVRYRRGKFLNALRPESARENEQMEIRVQEAAAPHRRYVVRQITGAIARRIVCTLKPGDEVGRGERFGMIKLGSRTELVLPREAALRVVARLGDTVRAGSTILAEFATDPVAPPG